MIKTVKKKICNERLTLQRIARYIRIKKQNREFRSAKKNMLSSKVEAKTQIDDLLERFRKLDIPIKGIRIDIVEFEKWCARFLKLIEFYKGFKEVMIEKPLEHFLTMRYLDLKYEDIFIDIAASSSPWADILNQKSCLRAYRAYA